MLKTTAVLDRPRPAPPCPSCGSKMVNTASKTVDASTYWRCAVCGEIWNLERRRAPEPYASRYH